jgi:hypothetical protein
MMRILVAILLAATALAGCSSAEPERELPPANFENLGLQATPTTGVIRGIAVDEAIRQLGGVDIGVTLLDGQIRNVTSAPDGAFGLDGLAPGTYFMVARKAGYLPVQASSEVVAGVAAPPLVKLLMTADPTTVPYVTVFVYEAFIGCSVTSPSVSVAVCDVGPLKAATNNEFLVNYEADKPPQWIQSEAVWESTQPLGSELSLSLTDFSQGPQITVNATAGPSPIHFTVNETTAQRFNYGVNNTMTIRLFSTAVTGTDVVPEEIVQGAYASNYGTVNGTGLPAFYQSNVVDRDPTGLVGNPFDNPNCLKYPALFNSCYRVGGAGVVVNQRVSVFTHIFYGYTPPPGWTFSATGQAPQPPA